MLHHKFLSLSLLTSVLVLAGCTQTQTTNTITETTNKNANVEVVINTNETVGNENTNDSNVNSDVDTSDPALSEVEGWLTYTNEEYGFSFRYPSDYSVSINDANTVKITDNELLLDGKINIETSDSFLTMTEREILMTEPGKETMPLVNEKFLTVNKLPAYRSLRQLKKGELLYPNAPDSTELTAQTWTEIEYRYLNNNNLVRLSFNIEGENYQNYYDVIDIIGQSFSM